MYFFAFATLFPIPVIAAAAVWGGVWVLTALAVMTALVAGLDHLVRRTSPALPDQEFPVANALSVILALAHFALLGAVVWGLAQPQLSLLGKVGVWYAAGLYFGQVSNANAHELIHKSGRILHRLGMWVYISLAFGHHTSAHVLVHHRHVATAQDPNSARQGEGFYRYAARAWRGSFVAGYTAEAARLSRVDRGILHNPYLLYLGGAALMLGIAIALGGWQGAAAYICVAGLAQVQLLLSDYVQHYGLTRAIGQNGKPEPVGDRHSWNSPHWYSSALMLNAPRHSDHHAHPGRAFPALTLPANGPTLPRAIPVMATVALVPPLWRRVMDPRVARWSA
ncbi:alkane 1-monooxygenase [Yoonia sp. R2331]|uniref:alkane 1-monooxygenase n=1 Tax=Yoonia sp. R2331 TaxID=3237238 RepID=UPI0034E47669